MLLKLLADVLKRLWMWTGKQCRRLWTAFLVFWQQLPMTWQWLLTGFFIIFILAMTVNVPGMAFWGICGFAAPLQRRATG